MTVVDEIKDRIDIVEVIGESVNLRKSGKNYTGFCPFHPNTRTPAFVVFPDTGTWRCFGACNEGGDVFSFVMKKDGLDFSESLRQLAERAGVELRPRTPAEEAREKEFDHLRQLLEAAVTFFRHQLTNSDEGAFALEYLQGRGLHAETIEIFELGYAPKSWEATHEHLLERRYGQEDLISSGLVSERDTGGIFDRFRHRLMIPIRDSRGRMAGFGARALDPDDVPKYLNSPQTPLFDKGRLLYGLNHSRKGIRAEDQAVIVEGYMDVIGLHQADHKNAVSPMGTALTEHQLRQLKRFSRKIVLALDADVAGDRATLRGLDVARQAMDKEVDPIFAARGLVRHEARLDAELRIATLPQGMDPDELIQEDPQAWPRLLGESKTIVDYVMESLISERDVDDAKHKAEIAERVLPLIEDVADRVEREAYRQKLARHLKVDERALLSYVPARPSSRRAAAASASRGEGERRAWRSSGDRLERFCLGVALDRPVVLYRLDRDLQSLDLERVSEHDFGGQERRLLFRSVRKSLAQQEMDPEDFLRESLDSALSEMAHELKEGLPPMDYDLPRVTAEILAAFLRLRKGLLSDRTEEVQFQLLSAQEAQADEEAEPELGLDELAQEVQKLALQKARLEQALATPGLSKAGTLHRSFGAPR